MRVQIISSYAAAAIAIGSAVTFAQNEAPSSQQFDWPAQTGQTAVTRGHSQGMLLAQSGPAIGDGSDPGYPKQQKELLNGPGYGVGTGSAHIADGSDPDYLKQQLQLQNEPGYNVGGGTAHVADDSPASNPKTQR